MYKIRTMFITFSRRTTPTNLTNCNIYDWHLEMETSKFILLTTIDDDLRNATTRSYLVSLTLSIPYSLFALLSSILTNWMPYLSQSSSIFSKCSRTRSEVSSPLSSNNLNQLISLNFTLITNHFLSLTEQNHQMIHVSNKCIQRLQRHIFNDIFIVTCRLVLNQPLEHILLTWQLT